MTMLNLINIIQSEERYRDRFHFFLSLDDKVNQQIIYVQHFDSDVSHYTNTTVKTPPTKYASGIKFWLWVFGDVFKRLRKNKYKWVVVEHLTGLVLFLLKLVRPFMRSKISLVFGCYNENRYYLKNEVWKADGITFITEEQDNFYKKNWKKRVRKDKFYFWSADSVITNSLRTFDWGREHKKKPFFRILNTVSEENVSCLETEIDRDIDLLYAGNLTPAKGIVSLLEAVENMDLKTVLIGDVKQEDEKWWLKVNKRFKNARYKVIDRVDRKELNDYMARAKIFVLPSYSEGSARVLIEALSRGGAVVASDIPGCHFTETLDTVIEYFEPGNAQTLKEKIVNKLKENNLKGKQLNNSVVFSKLSEKNIGEGLIQFYKQISNFSS